MRRLGIDLPPQPKRHKYGARRFKVDGVAWDSRWEHDCWLNLRSLQSRGKIHDLRRQVPFPLTMEGGELVKTYMADFVFKLILDGDDIVADAKSPYTVKGQAWRMTVKMMAAQHHKKVHTIIKGQSTPEDLVVHLRRQMLR